VPKKSLPRILSVEVTDEPYTLLIHWNQPSQKSTVNVSYLIDSFKAYAPLKSSPELFLSVRVGEYGTDVVWPDQLEIAADTLWRLTQEQAGKTMSAADFQMWRAKRAYTLDEAAAALGLSRRMVAYYDHGDKPIPRVVALAAMAFEYDPNPQIKLRP
jgi:DNA-binding XRE family transcriptional regulator